MTILDTLQERAHHGEVTPRLLSLAKEVTSDATEHLKAVNHQLPEFDVHDASHSERVVQNMEAILKQDGIIRLSSYELFLMYLAGYLHDCAMALPNWEILLLRMTEGTEGFTSNELSKSFANDGKAPYKLSEAIHVIRENATDLYGNYQNISSFIFICPTEDEFQRDLAERLIDYQIFRNGYTEELNKKVSQGSVAAYLEMSDLIRYEYIRYTHPQRVEQFIRNLSVLFRERLGGAWGEALAKDLAKICRSHGESMDYVQQLELNAGYYAGETANVQFIAVMLRLADVLHFSHDRAPKSLFAEKMIHSKESLLHWKAKFQGINYTLDERDGNGRIKIKYMAYCDEPSLYYFIQEYLNWVDIEVGNYIEWIRSMEYSPQTNNLAEKYRLQIADHVDRSQIRFNEEKFKPVPDLKFTLNQNRILELLMGVGLYKDKFLCLRELYQNALDACRCTQGIMNNRHVEMQGRVEFGLGKYVEEGRERTYLYCIDNGIGMTEDRIAKYFLKIGNSFYTSREFQQLKALWGDSFKPTSQFGIGILSCFMIGDKLDVTSKALSEDNYNGRTIRFAIDGPHENFYYLNPDELDLENLGQHGTLIKVFLSDKIQICDDDLQNLPLIIRGARMNSYRNAKPELFEKWDQHLYKFLYDSVGIPYEKVDVEIKMASGRREKLLPWTTPFDVAKFSRDDIDLLYSDYRYLNDGYNPASDYMQVKAYISTKDIRVNHGNLEFRFLLSLPLPGMPDVDYRVLAFESQLHDGNSVMIDGVSVGTQTFQLKHASLLDISNSAINFIGEDRPKLSVDRNTITSLSDQLECEIEKIPQSVAQRIIDEVEEHISKYQLSLDSIEVKMMWSYIFQKFSHISEWLVKHIVTAPEADLVLDEMVAFLGNQVGAGEFSRMSKVELKGFDYRTLGPTAKLVFIGKILNAKSVEVYDNDLIVESMLFSTIDTRKSRPMNSELIPLAVRADNWSGKYEQYDLVSSLWPIVPDKLYSALADHFEVRAITDRTKATADYGNSLAGLARIDPVLIHPKMGMFLKNEDRFKRNENWVGKFQNPAADFWLSELNNSGQTVFQEKRDFFLFAFIPPRALTDEERISLVEWRDEDPDYYVGVENGWSILVLGKTAQVIVLSGLREREEMVNKIKESFWEKNQDIAYEFTDGTRVK